MDSQEYIDKVKFTESSPDDLLAERLANPETQRILHASLGLCTESGEIQDNIKKHIFYGTPIDKINLVEEAGDIFWYLGILADAIGVGFEEMIEANVRKLSKRYPKGFTQHDAENRDIEAEIDALESITE